MTKKTKEQPLYTAVGTIWAFGNQFQIAVEYEMHEFGALTKDATLIGIYLPDHKFPTEIHPPIPINLYSDDIDRKRENEIEKIANIDLYRGNTEEDTESSDGAE
jgi:hypothetical protein